MLIGWKICYSQDVCHDSNGPHVAGEVIVLRTKDFRSWIGREEGEDRGEEGEDRQGERLNLY